LVEIISPQFSNDSAGLINRILGESRNYYSLVEQFSTLLIEINRLNKTAQGWEEVLNKQFDEMKALFVNAQNDTRESMHKMFGAWQLMPIDTLQRTCSLTSVMPGDFLGDLKADSIKTVTEKFLSIPGVGYTRESQEQMQKGVRLWNEYQQKCQEYNHAMCMVGVEALEVMRNKILSMSGRARSLKACVKFMISG
jgi:Poly(R)-hydroxyalkanoic acid synthase subunit (PHA_synth_III_E).